MFWNQTEEVVIQYCENTICHRILHIRMLHFMLYVFQLSKKKVKKLLTADRVTEIKFNLINILELMKMFLSLITMKNYH